MCIYPVWLNFNFKVQLVTIHCIKTVSYIGIVYHHTLAFNSHYYYCPMHLLLYDCMHAKSQVYCNCSDTYHIIAKENILIKHVVTCTSV